MATSTKLLPIHNRYDLNFCCGFGAYLYQDDQSYLDFGAGIAVNALGHCHPKLVKAITNQANKLWHVSNIYNGNELNNFAEKITDATFADYVFFCNSGAESIECAVKTIRRYFYVNNKPQKNRIITFSGAFHGRTITTISAAGKKKYTEGFEPLLEGFDNVEFGNIEAVKQAINDKTAGILIEPIQGEEGIRPCSAEFLWQLRKLCDDNDLLLAFDEVQCGNGRTGHLYAYQYYNVIPDILSTAKAIGGGFPLGACLMTKKASQGMTAGTHGTTYGGNPLAMAVGNAVIDEILSDGFLENVVKISNLLKEELIKIQNKFPQIISEIRGVGLMLGIKFHEEFANTKIVQQFIDNKLLTIPAGENVVRILPPLIINENHVKEAIVKIEKSLNSLKDS